MGNRTVITFIDKSTRRKSPAIYLHWNGGMESVIAFLMAYAKVSGRFDLDYMAARFTQMVGNFFGGDTSLGLTAKSFDPGDHGELLIQVNDAATPEKRFEIIEKRLDGELLSKEQIASEIQAALQHEYLTPDDADTTMVDDIIARNPMFASGFEFEAQKTLEQRRVQITKAKLLSEESFASQALVHG